MTRDLDALSEALAAHEVKMAALRVCQETIRLTKPNTHDGVVCDLVPRGILERLIAACAEYYADGGDWWHK